MTRMTAILVCCLLLAPLGVPQSDPAREITNSLGMKLRRIPATKPFYLGVFEVTQDQYTKIVGDNPSWFRPAGGGKPRVRGLDTAAFPVEMVSRDDAIAFCAKLSARSEEKKAGRVYRLPTEAEWEYACRAGTTTAFHGGDRLSSDDANFHGYYPNGGAEKSTYLGRTCRVGTYTANSWGLHDLHGNVWEWCSDSFDETHTKGVIRGGSWYGGGRLCRTK